MPSRPRGDPRNVHLGLMLSLTAATGMVDAAGFLGLDRVFTGNVTGSIVILGMGIAGTADLPVIGPICALMSFMVGALVAGRVLRPMADGWSGRSTLLFTVVGVLVGASAVVILATGRAPTGPLVYAVIILLAFAMGVQTATARQLSVKDVNTVVVTTVVAGLVADSPLGLRRPQPVFRRVVGIAGMGVGALLGALTWRFHLGLALALAAAVILTVSAVGHWRGRTSSG